MRTIGRAEVLDDPRFVDWFRHKENETKLRAIIEDALAAEHAKSWQIRPSDTGAPVRAFGVSRMLSAIRADRRAGRSAGCGHTVWRGASDGLGVSDVAQERAAGHGAAGAWRARRRNAQRGWLLW